MSKLIIALLIVVLFLALTPWQAFQNSWNVNPGEQLTIHWHSCIRVIGSATIFNITFERQFKGYTIENRSTAPLLVTSCDL
jgi:hypothetical protein